MKIEDLPRQPRLRGDYVRNRPVRQPEWHQVLQIIAGGHARMNELRQKGEDHRSRLTLRSTCRQAALVYAVPNRDNIILAHGVGAAVDLISELAGLENRYFEVVRPMQQKIMPPIHDDVPHVNRDRVGKRPDV